MRYRQSDWPGLTRRCCSSSRFCAQLPGEHTSDVLTSSCRRYVCSAGNSVQKRLFLQHLRVRPGQSDCRYSTSGDILEEQLLVRSASYRASGIEKASHRYQPVPKLGPSSFSTRGLSHPRHLVEHTPISSLHRPLRLPGRSRAETQPFTLRTDKIAIHYPF